MSESVLRPKTQRAAGPARDNKDQYGPRFTKLSGLVVTCDATRRVTTVLLNSFNTRCGSRALSRDGVAEQVLRDTDPETFLLTESD